MTSLCKHPRYLELRFRLMQFIRKPKGKGGKPESGTTGVMFGCRYG